MSDHDLTRSAADVRARFDGTEPPALTGAIDRRRRRTAVLALVPALLAVMAVAAVAASSGGGGSTQDLRALDPGVPPTTVRVECVAPADTSVWCDGTTTTPLEPIGTTVPCDPEAPPATGPATTAVGAGPSCEVGPETTAPPTTGPPTTSVPADDGPTGTTAPAPPTTAPDPASVGPTTTVPVAPPPTVPPTTRPAGPYRDVAVTVVRSADWESGRYGFGGEPGEPIAGARVSLVVEPSTEYQEVAAGQTGGDGVARLSAPEGRWSVSVSLPKPDDELCGLILDGQVFVTVSGATTLTVELSNQLMVCS